MRSLLIATAVCALISLTGCSFTITTPCTSLSHQSRLTGECGGCSDCDSCSPGKLMSSMQMQPECTGVNFGEGAPAGFSGMPNLAGVGGGKLRGRLSTIGCGKGGNCDGGCEGGCETAAEEDCGCDSGACGDETYVTTDGGLMGRLGMGLFQKGSKCETGCEDGSCGLGSGMMMNRAGVVRAAVGSKVPTMGCGRFGCGRDGKLCLSCNGKLKGLIGGITPPQRGSIPHTQVPPMQMGGQGVPSYVYPYYTTRGPRDFLMANPPSIGY